MLGGAVRTPGTRGSGCTILSPFQVMHHARVLGHGGDHRGFEVLLARRTRRNSSTSCRRPRPRPCAPGSRRSPARCRQVPRTSCGTVSRSTYRPSASSPMATDTPPAPKSLQRLMRRQASPSAEQALELALDGRVALLHLGAVECPATPRCEPSTSRWRRRCRHGRCDRPAGSIHVAGGRAVSRRTLVGRGGAHDRAAPPCAWPHSPAW